MGEMIESPLTREELGVLRATHHALERARSTVDVALADLVRVGVPRDRLDAYTSAARGDFGAEQISAGIQAVLVLIETTIQIGSNDDLYWVDP